MNFKVNKKDVFSEFEWVLRVLDSSETKVHLEVVQNCFFVWEKKHTFKNLKSEEISFINSLKSRYWAKFKNKIFSIGSSAYDLLIIENH